MFSICKRVKHASTLWPKNSTPKYLSKYEYISTKKKKKKLIGEWTQQLLNNSQKQIPFNCTWNIQLDRPCIEPYNNGKCPSLGAWNDKLPYTHTMEYYSAWRKTNYSYMQKHEWITHCSEWKKAQNNEESQFYG